VGLDAHEKECMGTETTYLAAGARLVIGKSVGYHPSVDSFLGRLKILVRQDSVQISEHGYDALMDDNLFIREILAGMQDAVLVEEYPSYPKGPCALVLLRDGSGMPIHFVWGIPRGKTSPAVLVTAYRPDPARWSDDFVRRR